MSHPFFSPVCHTHPISSTSHYLHVLSQANIPSPSGPPISLPSLYNMWSYLRFLSPYGPPISLSSLYNICGPILGSACPTHFISCMSHPFYLLHVPPILFPACPTHPICCMSHPSQLLIYHTYPTSCMSHTSNFLHVPPIPCRSHPTHLMHACPGHRLKVMPPKTA